MKPEHTKEFNVEHAKAGAPYAQRNGLAARIGIWDAIGSYPLAGVRAGIDGMEGSSSWTAKGKFSLGYAAYQFDLVMTPLGYCEGKPVFVGDELEQINGDLGWAVGAAFNNFTNLRWKRTAPVMPTFLPWDSPARILATPAKRTEIEAYWKALDEFNEAGK
jgi:hypothetical protein